MNAGNHGRPSRRKFLHSTVVTGLGLVGLPALGAAPSGGLPVDPKIVAAAELGLRNVMLEGLDDVLPRPFELDLLEANPTLRKHVISTIVTGLVDGSDQPASSIDWILLPKWTRNAFKKAARIDLLDSIRYLALAILVAEATEPRRLAAGLTRVLSHRFQPNNPLLFDSRFDLTSLRTETFRKLSDDKATYLVHADIADFYPSIRIDRLREALARHQVEQSTIDALVSMLCKWVAPEKRGLPIGPQGSHILAEAALIDVDKDLQDLGIDFIRFVDDFRLFAPDQFTARQWLASLSGRLETEGLTLNPAKTMIDRVTRSQYAQLLTGSTYAGVLESGALLAQQERPKKPRERKRTKQSRSATRRAPPDSAMKEGLQRLDAAALLVQLREAQEVELESFGLLVESTLCRGEASLLPGCLDIIDRAPHCIPYLVELLIDESGHIPAEIRDLISDGFAQRLQARKFVRDFEVLYAAKLLGADDYARPAAIHNYLRSGPPATSAIVLRSLLDALSGRIGRSEANALVQAHEGSDPWVKRAVLRLALPHLDRQQKQAAYRRMMRNAEEDSIIQTLLKTGPQLGTA